MTTDPYRHFPDTVRIITPYRHSLRLAHLGLSAEIVYTIRRDHPTLPTAHPVNIYLTTADQHPVAMIDIGPSEETALWEWARSPELYQKVLAGLQDYITIRTLAEDGEAEQTHSDAALETARETPKETP